VGAGRRMLTTFGSCSSRLGRKVSDEFVCRGHHREVHRSANEASWWSKVGITYLTARKGYSLASGSPRGGDEDLSGRLTTILTALLPQSAALFGEL
jgi:hypothetical protein